MTAMEELKDLREAIKSLKASPYASYMEMYLRFELENVKNKLIEADETTFLTLQGEAKVLRRLLAEFAPLVGKAKEGEHNNE